MLPWVSDTEAVYILDYECKGMLYVRKLYCMYRCMYNKRPGQCLQCYHGCQASWGQGAWRVEQQGIQPHSGRHCYGKKMRNSHNIIFWRLTGLSCWSGCTHICRTGYWLPQWLIRYMHEYWQRSIWAFILLIFKCSSDNWTTNNLTGWKQLPSEIQLSMQSSHLIPLLWPALHNSRSWLDDHLHLTCK